MFRVPVLRCSAVPGFTNSPASLVYSKSFHRVFIALFVEYPWFGGKRGYAGMRICGYADMRVCGYAGMRICGYADMRVCGYADMRVCGYAGMRICGYADMRVRRTGLITNGFQKLINNSCEHKKS